MNYPGNTKMLQMLSRSLAAMTVLLTIVTSTFAADFDSDGKADLAVFRPSSSTWSYDPSATDLEPTAFQWGHSSDVLVPSDYDGDDRTDFAVWRPENGVWYIHQSGDGQVLLVKWGTTTMHPTGGLPDVPVPADYDGDGLTDLGMWRPDTGEWWVLRSSNDYDQNAPLVFRWGKLGDVPVQADYDGDGRADLAIFRSMENRWYIRESASGKMFVQPFGLAGLDTLVPADYTGDRKADLAVYRSGTWYVYDSSSPRLRSFNFGQAGDLPVNTGAVKQSIVAVP